MTECVEGGVTGGVVCWAVLEFLRQIKRWSPKASRMAANDRARKDRNAKFATEEQTKEVRWGAVVPCGSGQALQGGTCEGREKGWQHVSDTVRGIREQGLQGVSLGSFAETVVG